MKTPIQQAEEAVTERVEPLCVHFGLCGGCSLQHLPYDAQVRWRGAWVAGLLERELGPGLPGLRAYPMLEPWGHRSKMEFAFGQEGERLLLGLHPRHRFQRIVEIEQCRIAHPEVNRLLAAVKRAAAGFGLKAYDTRRRQGFWRYAVARAARTGDRLMLLLITNEGPREPLEAMARELPREVPALKSLYWGVSSSISDVARPERLERLAGEEFLEDSVGDLRCLTGPLQFVQPNHALTGTAYRVLREEARLSGKEAVYDLYCGVGLISLSLAGQAGSLFGVEAEPRSIELAERNAALNGISNALFFCGKTEDLLRNGALFRAGPPPDVVVLDPPRAGLHGQVIASLLQARAPRLLYLSCNPASLARDLKLLLGGDSAYRVESLRMFDFFPHTPHAETLAVLSRAG